MKMVRFARLKSKLVFLLSVFLVMSTLPAQAVWQFESDNKSSGLSAYASTFWAEGFGPVSWERLLNLPLDDGDLWATLTVGCVSKKLNVVIAVTQAGSGNDEIRLDNPGYLTITLNGLPAKRYRTVGSDYPDTFYVSNTDSKTLVKTMLKRSYLSLSPRIKYSNKKLSMLFDITALTKGKTRFKYAGCTI